MSKSKWNKNRLIDGLFFLLMIIGITGVMFFLTYHQAFGSEEHYHSDIEAYILEMQGLNVKYSFPYPVLFRFGAFWHLFFGAELSMALATTLLNSFAIVVTKYYFNAYGLQSLEEKLASSKWFKNHTWLAGIILSILACSLFFISMIYFPNNFILPGLRFKYLGVFSANPFHNATYMAARPFAIMAFFAYVGLLDAYEKKDVKKEIWDYIWFSVALLAATMTKPSFTIVLVGAAGLIMLFRLFAKKFKNFVPTILLGLCFIPTFIDLLYQFKGVFVPNEGAEGGIGFGLGRVWHQYCTNFPAAIVLAMAFPLVVLICNFKELKKNTMYRFSWQIYGMSFAMAYLLYEKGFREPDFNFSWGYMYGIFFGFLGSVLLLIQVTCADRTGISEKERKVQNILLAGQWLGLFAHIVCGTYYFYGILRGNMYY